MPAYQAYNRVRAWTDLQTESQSASRVYKQSQSNEQIDSRLYSAPMKYSRVHSFGASSKYQTDGYG